ncbi:MAG: Restriction endonuclease [Phormidium sp. OSCR]|nr:MAG: Restriction endonuclease [Phormidium sp. OSCR]
MNSPSPKVIRSIVQGIIKLDSQEKQELGRKYAFALGLTPGPRGADGGRDGVGIVNGKKVYFQCRLSRSKLGAPVADAIYGAAQRERADLIVVLAGVGYTGPTPANPKSGFENCLRNRPDGDCFKIHLLTLADIYEKNEAFDDAVADLPGLRKISRNDWRETE